MHAFRCPSRITARVVCCLLTGAALALVACGGGGDGDSGFEPLVTMTLKAGDGAEVSFDYDSEQGEATGRFERIADPSGEEVEDRKNVSAIYALSLEGPVATDLIITIPVVSDLLPEGFEPVSLVAQVQNPETGVWEYTGSLPIYDPQAKTLSFSVGFETVLEVEDDPAPRRARPLGSLSLDSIKYRLGVTLWTEAVTVTIPGSQFTITYYPSTLGKAYSIRDDAAWGSESGKATRADLPDYIEDLDAALNDVYGKFLALTYNGSPLFSPLSEKQRRVYVDELKGDAGASPLGGPMKMANNVIKGWDDLRGVTGHEMIHVFQGQFFASGDAGAVVHLLIGTGSWLWFIEGTANYYSARVQNLDPASKDDLYGRGESGQYLSSGLASGHKESYYLTAHFLDFITERAGTDVIAAALNAGSASRSVHALSAALLASPRKEALGTILAEYGRQLVRYPQKDNGIHLSILDKILLYNTGNNHLSSRVFKDDVTYVTLTRSLPPLGMAYAEVRANNTSDALLVIDIVTEKPSSVSTFTWDRISGTDAGFNDVLPLEDYSGNTLTVANVGRGGARTAFSQIAINTDATRYYPIVLAYYLLVPPQILAIEPGLVTISTTSLGNIPLEVVSEFWVYRRKDNGNFEKLGSVSRGEGAQTTFASGKIGDGDTLAVQVADRYGNVWPVLQEGEAGTVYVGCRTFEEGVYRYGCTAMTWAGEDTEADDFKASATQTCLNDGYRQYTDMAFDLEDDCKSWCTASAAGGGVCSTPGEGGSDGPAFCRNVADGNDVCDANTCYTCSSDSENGYVKLYDCADGCFTSPFTREGVTVTLCECN